MRVKRTVPLIIFVLLTTCTLVKGQTSHAPRSQPFPHFTQKEGQLDAEGFPTSGATLCVLAKPDTCFVMPSKQEDKDLTYEFGLEPHSERLPLADGGSWVFFTAMFSGGGSGTLTRFAVLRYTSEGKIVNLLPWVGVTNVSQYAMWNLPQSSTYPVLVLADFVWGKGETHFDSHFYTVEIWIYDSNTDKYVKAFEYKTSKKYGGGDSSPIRVLAPERDEILRRLKSMKK
ncbi:MAG: hypothetical protein ABSC48_04360 [Terracidiphilus sp.]|jgi:hypothetical protein